MAWNVTKYSARMKASVFTWHWIDGRVRVFRLFLQIHRRIGKYSLGRLLNLRRGDGRLEIANLHDALNRSNSCPNEGVRIFARDKFT